MDLEEERVCRLEGRGGTTQRTKVQEHGGGWLISQLARALVGWDRPERHLGARSLNAVKELFERRSRGNLELISLTHESGNVC